MRKVSDYLREERVKKGLTLDEVSKETKIKKEFLSFIEEGKFSSLPSRAYALGFVKNYANYLGLPERQTLAFFRRESLDEELEVVPRYKRKHHILQKGFFFTPRGIVTMIAALIILGYIGFQYGSLFFGPQLTISSPSNGQVIKQNVVTVSGKTDQYATVLVDNEQTYVDISGEFKKSIYVFSGEKTITVVAKNRFGKETKKMITVKVE